MSMNIPSSPSSPSSLPPGDAPTPARSTWLSRVAGAVGLCGLLALSVVASPPPVQSVPKVDAARYAGTWYELARLPNRFQEQCKGDVTAVYEAKPDGTLGVENSCRTSGGERTVTKGRATQASGSDTGARWKVSFLPSWLQWFPLGRGDYWIVMLDAEYRYAVVSEPSREFLWILSRTPTMDPASYDALLSKLQSAGYPVGELVRTPQAAAAAANPVSSSLARLSRML